MASLGFRSTSDIKPKALQIQIATHEEILGKLCTFILTKYRVFVWIQIFISFTLKTSGYLNYIEKICYLHLSMASFLK